MSTFEPIDTHRPGSRSHCVAPRRPLGSRVDEEFVGAGVVNHGAIVGRAGRNVLRFGERVQRLVGGGLLAEETDVDDVR